jgi:SulP family sulfate permease
LFALGSANLISSFFGSYVTFGSLPRSNILASTGGRTNMAGLFAGVSVLILFSAGSSVLKFLPRPTLAAIVFKAAINLIEFKEVFFLFKMKSIKELFFFTLTFCMTFFVAISEGILLCLLLACFLILRRTTVLQMALLGSLQVIQKDLTTKVVKYVDITEYPEASVIDNVLLLSLKGALEFYNAGRLRRRIELLLGVEEKILASHTTSEFVTSESSFRLFVNADSTGRDFTFVFDFTHCSNMVFFVVTKDSAGLFILLEIVESFRSRGTRVIFCGIQAYQRVLFSKSGILAILGSDVADSVLDAVAMTSINS